MPTFAEVQYFAFGFVPFASTKLVAKVVFSSARLETADPAVRQESVSTVICQYRQFLVYPIHPLPVIRVD